MPPCESRMTGLRGLSDAANAVDPTSIVVNAARAATARMDLSGRTEGIGGPVGLKMPDCSCNALPYPGVIRAASRDSPGLACGRLKSEIQGSRCDKSPLFDGA